MNDRQRIFCTRADEREALVTILARNGYTVRIGKESRGNGKAGSNMFVEYWKEGQA